MVKGIGIAESAYTKIFSYEKGLQKLKEHGYGFIDYQSFVDTENGMFEGSVSDFEKRVLAHKRTIDDCGLIVSQVHGPWRYPPRDATAEDRAERLDKMLQSAHGTRLLGCENMVIHPIMPFGAQAEPDTQAFWDMNYEFMRRLCRGAADEGVTICLENMPMRAHSLAKPEAIVRFVKTLNEPNMKVCLDTGHCAVFGISPADAVRTIGAELLRVLHIHDNDGTGDQHRLPGEGVIDWDAFASALIEIGFDGVVSLECAVKPTEEALEEKQIALCNIAKRIAAMK